MAFRGLRSAVKAEQKYVSVEMKSSLLTKSFFYAKVKKNKCVELLNRLTVKSEKK
jgi:hypothetical protein